jgi:hypothetical protein
MGRRDYHEEDYDDRQSSNRNMGYSTAFIHDEDIRHGRVKAGVHPSLNPFGVKIRESQDSAEHPVTLPIIMDDDLTGSMGHVPEVLQRREKELMGLFLKDKASGAKYIRDAYPAIMLMGTDDYEAMRGEGCLQVGQFESGVEIDKDLGNLWMTGNGGGNEGESYDLALYFAARHTTHDHWERRHKRGYMFIFGDEPLYSDHGELRPVDPQAIKDVIGDDVEKPISIHTIIKEVQKRYHLIWGVPFGHENTYPGYMNLLKKALGAEMVRTFDPEKVCEFIVSTVAMLEGVVTIDDLITDGVVSEKDRQALVPLSTRAVAQVDLGDLPEVAGAARATERL